MSNCNITLEIIGYEPKNLESISFNDLNCIFKLDNFEGTINIGKYNIQKINHIVKNIKNDLKYMIRVINLKTKSLIGITEIIIPISLIKSTNVSSSNEINKQCSLTMITSTKHLFFGSFSNEKEIKLNIKVKVDVISRNHNSLVKKNNKTQNYFSPKIIKNKDKILFEIIKTPPSNKSNNVFYSKNEKFLTLNNENRKVKNGQNKIKRINQIKKEFIKKKNQMLKSKLRLKTLNDEDIYLKISPNRNNRKLIQKYNNSMTELRNSTIEQSKYIPIIENSIFGNYIETEDNSEKIDNEIYSSLNYLKNNFNIFTNENNHNNLNIKKVEDNFRNLYNFSSLINFKLNILIQKRKDLINNYLSNLEKVNYINKQKNRLKTLNIKSNYKEIKVNLNSKINSKIYRNQNQTHKKELKIFQNIFNSYYFEYDILKYKESQLTKNMNIDNKLKILISCVRACVFSYGNISQLYEEDEDSKIKLKALLFKYKIKEIEEYSNIPFDMLLTNNNNNNCNKINYDIDKIKIIKEVDEEKEEDSED